MRARTPYWAGLHIALIAMLFRAFLPSGWMPAPTAHVDDAPWLSFVICTSDGLIQLDESAANFYQDGEDTPENGDTVHSYTSCPYATAAPLASVVATLDVVLYAVDFSPTVFHAVDPTLVHKDLFQRKRSRAPPFLTS